MLTKEKCLNAVDGLILNWGYEGLEEDLEPIYQLINEHFAMLNELKTGELSDGYHTFNELYHHRAVLFSVIVNQNRDIAWKSKKHHDGTMYDGMFIVGIDTPQGQYSYHYDIEPYWNMFECKELDNSPVWDGHEPKDIDRLKSIDKNSPLKWEELKEGMLVYDKNIKSWIEIDKTFEDIEKYVSCWSIGWPYEKRFPYEPNRFYRKEVQNERRIFKRSR